MRIRFNGALDLRKYGILVKEQFVFRCNNSTEIVIYTLINKILSSLNNKIMVGGLFCDLQKAFDYVNYDIIIKNGILWYIWYC